MRKVKHQKNTGVKVLRKHENAYTGIRVELNQKTTASGKIIHAVVITNIASGHHFKILKHDGIAGAFYDYKLALA